MWYGGSTDLRTDNEIVPLYTLVWCSLRIAPMRLKSDEEPVWIETFVQRSDDSQTACTSLFIEFYCSI